MKMKTVISAVRPDGSIIEMLYQPEQNNTTFAVYRDDEINYAEQIEIKDDAPLAPFPPNNDLVRNRVILFPSEAVEYGNEQELLEKICAFIHKYLQVGQLFEQIACYYVLLTWVYDKFNELPYLRALGDYGTGKTRFLKVIGSLCYKPIFANGAITVSPIFRIIQMSRGTLILNEADFNRSEEWSEITKILNNGFEKGFPVLRSEATGKSFDVKTFDVFGPKILSARNRFDDRALESRFLTEEMDNNDLRDDIPINLPDGFWDEALAIRNQLLMWRFRHYHTAKLNNSLVDRSIEPRLNQILIPLCSIITDSNLINEVKNLIRQMNTQILDDRGMTAEAEIIEAILGLFAELNIDPTVKDICNKFNRGKSEREQATNRKMGYWLRQKLGLKLVRTREGYILEHKDNLTKIDKLKAKYGLKDWKPE